MPSQPDPAADPGAVRLTGHGTTVSAEELRNRLVQAADAGATTAIDASEMLSVGQAVLQLLIAAQAEAASGSRKLHFTGASAAFSERVVGCQLADAIGLEIEKDLSL
jgi:anti-anti-sigma regulatory factor